MAVGQLVHSPLLLKLVAARLGKRPHFAIWEWFEARSLADLLREYVRLPISSALWIGRQCAEGLEALLQAGLTHGDLRAENILVETRTGLVKLTGVENSRRVSHSSVREFGRESGRSGPAADDESVVSPPHLHGVGRDLHGLGTTFYRALTGRIPFAAETPAEMVRGRHVSISAELHKIRPEISLSLAELVAGLLPNQPERQIGQPSELARRLMELEISELARLT